MLSFPWLAWDVIKVVRRINMIESKIVDTKFSFDPLSDKVTNHIYEYIQNRRKAIDQFFDQIEHPEKRPKNEQTAWRNIALYCKQHLGELE